MVVRDLHVQGYGKVASYAEGKLFLVEELFACNKACPWWPGDRSGHHREGRKAMA